MSPAAIVTAVIGTFFLIGIAVGVLLVIAISALRVSTKRVERKLARRTGTGDGADPADAGWPGPGPAAAGWTGTMRPSWEEPPDTDEDDEDEGPPPWPRHRGLLAGSR